MTKFSKLFRRSIDLRFFYTVTLCLVTQLITRNIEYYGMHLCLSCMVSVPCQLTFTNHFASGALVHYNEVDSYQVPFQSE